VPIHGAYRATVCRICRTNGSAATFCMHVTLHAAKTDRRVTSTNHSYRYEIFNEMLKYLMKYYRINVRRIFFSPCIAKLISMIRLLGIIPFF